MLDDLEVFIVSLAFRDAASERPWQERAVLKSETLFRGRLVADHFEAESDDDEDYLPLGKDDNFVVLFDLTRCETADKAAKALARLKSYLHRSSNRRPATGRYVGDSPSPTPERDPKSRTRSSRAWCPCSLGSPSRIS